MVVIIVKKYKPVPQKFSNCSNKEATPKPLDGYAIRGYGPSPTAENNTTSISSLLTDPSEEKKLPAIYPAAWGWNANGRAGNITEEQVSVPRFTQKSADNRFIACAAGYHHSLLVADNGVVYSFGEGRDGQLGYGNPFFDRPKKGGDVQVIPRAVNPSGVIKNGRDLKIVEVACGGTFSLAREGGNEEGVALCHGLQTLEMALKKIHHDYYDSPPVQYAWAAVRQERAELSNSFSGRIVSWGRGNAGQLGQGKRDTYMPYPQPVPKLDNISITQIAAGKNHCLAISKEGRLYAWGMGKSGCLGFKNNENQFFPKLVTYFDHNFVTFCAAGDAHSVVIIKNKKLSVNPLMNLPVIASFGRGAHGRLGMNNNKSNSTPRVILHWPPSSKGFYFREVAAGGAHSLALCTKDVPKTLSNPYGIVTNVYAWGFGTNGQLGTGDKLTDSFVPVKVKMPKWELVTQISAGRSWSVARTVAGDIYTWGKGMRGQLGHGARREFSFAPRKVETFASFVGISSGYAHNVAITTTRKTMNKKVSETFVKDVADSERILGMDKIDVFNAGAKRVQKSLAGHKSTSMISFDCCRRKLPHRINKIRVHCLDCDMDDICALCCIHCHRNHNVVAMDYKSTDYDNIKHCKCGVFNERCRLLPVIPEVRNDDITTSDQSVSTYPLPYMKPTYSSILQEDTSIAGQRMKKKKTSQHTRQGGALIRSHSVLKEDKVSIAQRQAFESEQRERLAAKRDTERAAGMSDWIPRTISARKFLAAKSIQGLARSYIGKIQLKRMMAYVKYVRHTACEQYWKESIMGEIWSKYQHSHDLYRESREILDMEKAEKERKTFDFYHNLQSSLLGMDFMMEGVRQLMGQASILVPSPDTLATLDANSWSYDDDVMDEAIHPSYVYSLKALRDINLMKAEAERLPERVMSLVSKKFPRNDSTPGTFFDGDVQNFTSDMVLVPSIKEHKEEIYRIAKLSISHITAAEKSGEYFAVASTSVVKAMAITTSDLQSAINVLQDTDFHDLYLKLSSKKAKRERKRRPITIEEVTRERDRLLCRFRRRQTVASPYSMYERVRLLRPYTLRRSGALRRNSLPNNITDLYADTKPNFSYTDEIYQSLDVFYGRQVMIQEHYLEEYSYVWKKTRPSVKKQKMQKALGYAWLNPRLPNEMNQLITHRGQPLRRYSIGDPERLAKQVAVQFETRNTLLGLQTRAKKKAKIRIRRRSFDHGEILDDKDKINTSLGYVFDESFKPPMINQLQKDSTTMDALILKAELEETDPLKQIHLMGGKNAGIYDHGGYAGGGGGGGGAGVHGEEEVEIIVWKEFYADDGTVYYYNELSGQSLWDKPTGDDNVHILQQYQDTKDKQWYWFNTTTSESIPL